MTDQENKLRIQMKKDAMNFSSRGDRDNNSINYFEALSPSRFFLVEGKKRSRSVYNVDSRPQSGEHNKPFVDPIRELRGQGRSNGQIAATLRLTPGRVAGIRSKHGIP